MTWCDGTSKFLRSHEQFSSMEVGKKIQTRMNISTRKLKRPKCFNQMHSHVSSQMKGNRQPYTSPFHRFLSSSRSSFDEAISNKLNLVKSNRINTMQQGQMIPMEDETDPSHGSIPQFPYCE